MAYPKRMSYSFKIRTWDQTESGWCRNPAKSGRHRRIPEIPCQIPARQAGAARSLAIRPGYRPFWPNLLPVRPGSSQNGGIPTRTAGFRSTGRDSAVFCWISAKNTGILQKWPDSGYFAGICICQILKKNIFILFYINIFYFVNNFFLINMIKLKYKKYL